MLLSTTEQTRELDRLAIGEYGIKGPVLMEAAGKAVADFVATLTAPLAETTTIVILCGPGNNGGDGFVAARHLIQKNVAVRVFLLGQSSKVHGDAKKALEAFQALGTAVFEVKSDVDLPQCLAVVDQASVIVDALLGTGSRPNLPPLMQQVIAAANAARTIRVAVDIPTGVNADSGRVLGPAFHANHTLTLGRAKLGIASDPAVTYVGQLHLVDIGIPAAAEGRVPAAGILLSHALVGSWIEPRDRRAHKGTFGHALVLAGSMGKTGAALLTSSAVLRSGAGLCTLAVPGDVLSSIGGSVREVMSEPLVDAGQDLDATPAVFQRIRALVPGKTAVALGPGMPVGDAPRRFVASFAAECPRPLVIDADGLNALVGQVHVLVRAPAARILTPHPGEMARLLETTTEEVQASRIEAARELCKRSGSWVVLKGMRTVIAGPKQELLINPTGNPGMATAGVGDVLTGVITGLLAQGYPPDRAAALGVYVHGLAGDLAAEKIGEIGLIASDVLDTLPSAFTELRAT